VRVYFTKGSDVPYGLVGTFGYTAMMKHQQTTCLVFLLVALLALTAQASPSTDEARQSNRVGLVVDFGDGRSITQCVTFDETEISGYDVLMRSDLDVATREGVICRIQKTGCPTEDCFCAMPDYWSYWRLIEETGAWQYSSAGAGSTTVHDGAVEGWSWGSEPPPAPAFHQICSPSTIYLPLVLSGRG
jgi:hypothetical protein